MGKKKINDYELIRLIKEGKSQKEVAEILGVTPAAVCQRLKRLGPPDAPTFNKLTPKQKKFCISIVEGKTQTLAALESHECNSLQSAKVLGSRLMKKPEIKMSIKELMDYYGIDKSYRIQRLKHIIDSPDLNIAYKGLDMSFKLDGSYAPEKHLHLTREDFDNAILQLEELEKKRLELRQQLKDLLSLQTQLQKEENSLDETGTDKND